MTAKTPSSLASEIDRTLRSLSEPGFAEGQRRFFKHEVQTYGVRGAEVQRAAREVYLVVKRWRPEDRDDLMERLWRLDGLEAAALGIYLYRRFARSFGAREFDLFESWVDCHVTNWATCDGVSSWLLASSIVNVPDLSERLLPWPGSPNRWKRRAAAVSLLQEAKAGRQTERIFEIALALLPQRDDMVEKGVGWLLKETYPKRAAETVGFLTAQRQTASRLTLRYAAEKMSPEDKALVLEK